MPEPADTLRARRPTRAVHDGVHSVRASYLSKRIAHLVFQLVQRMVRVVVGSYQKYHPFVAALVLVTLANLATRI